MSRAEECGDRDQSSAVSVSVLAYATLAYSHAALCGGDDLQAACTVYTRSKQVVFTWCMAGMHQYTVRWQICRSVNLQKSFKRSDHSHQQSSIKISRMGGRNRANYFRKDGKERMVCDRSLTCRNGV